MIVQPEGSDRAGLSLIDRKVYVSWSDEEREKALQDPDFTVSISQFVEEVVSRAKELRDSVNREDVGVNYESFEDSIENVEEVIESFEE